MFLRRNNLVTDVEHFQAEAFAYYRDAILDLHQQAWQQDSIRGRSFIYYKILQYYLAIYLVTLMYYDFIESFYTLEELYIKYKIDCHRKAFACNGIDIDKIIEIFNIKERKDCVRKLKHNYIIGADDCCKRQYSMAELMEKDCEHINYITDDHTVETSILNGFVLEGCEALELKL